MNFQLPASGFSVSLSPLSPHESLPFHLVPSFSPLGVLAVPPIFNLSVTFRVVSFLQFMHWTEPATAADSHRHRAGKPGPRSRALAELAWSLKSRTQIPRRTRDLLQPKPLSSNNP